MGYLGDNLDSDQKHTILNMDVRIPRIDYYGNYNSNQDTPCHSSLSLGPFFSLCIQGNKCSYLRYWCRTRIGGNIAKEREY